MEEYKNENKIFQRDNASIHAFMLTKSWIAENNIKVMDWPACSPDLNPIETLLDLFASEI